MNLLNYGKADIIENDTRIMMHKLLHKGIFSIIHNRRFEKESSQKLHKDILRDENILCDEHPEMARYVDFIKNSSKVSVFNSSFEDNYITKRMFYFDKNRGVKYLIHENKNLFFPADMTNKQLNSLYNSICCEQDLRSPHRYLDEKEDLSGYIIFDCGCAEANFSLDVADKAKGIYLFEGDRRWIKPLRATFEPWKNKVRLKIGLLGKRSEGYISLREYMEDLESRHLIDIENDKIFIKMDIEGAERYVFDDILPILKKAKHMKLAVCVYHNQDDEDIIKGMIPEGYAYRIREGYMLFLSDHENLKFPYFRHGIMRIERVSEQEMTAE